MLNNRTQELTSRVSEKIHYPYLPLSLGMALLAILHLFPIIDQVMLMYSHLSTPGSLRHELEGISLTDITHFSFSLFLMTMAIGLWFRLQISWLLSLLSLIFILIHRIQSDTPVEFWLLFYNIMLICLIVISRKYFNHNNMRLDTLAAIISLLVLYCYSVFGTYHLGDQFSPTVNTLSDALYVSVMTTTTVGFGDFIPTTEEARLFIVSIIIFSISVLSTAIGATLIPAFVNRIEHINEGKKKRMNRTNHYIIVGYSALAGNTYRELHNKNENITVILKSHPDRDLFLDKDVDIVIGDGSDLEALQEAGANQAKAILALLDDDSENAFVILAAKELKVKAKTVAAVSNSKYLSRVRRVHPDIILAPQVLGGELLTNMLMGERIDINSIMQHLLGHSDVNATQSQKK